MSTNRVSNKAQFGLHRTLLRLRVPRASPRPLTKLAFRRWGGGGEKVECPGNARAKSRGTLSTTLTIHAEKMKLVLAGFRSVSPAGTQNQGCKFFPKAVIELRKCLKIVDAEFFSFIFFFWSKRFQIFNSCHLVE